jgi:hypothetical protein
MHEMSNNKMNNDNWEYFTRDSFGHELVFETCEYCQEEKPVQLWSIAEEDFDGSNIASITMSSYPFQIKNLMKEIEIHNRKVWVCVGCLNDLNPSN